MDELQSRFSETIGKLRITHQEFLDYSVPYKKERWGSFAVLLTLFLLRVFISQGWYIICYGLAIYLLNLLLGFLTPKFDPSLEQELRSSNLEEGEDQTEEEFRPFVRRLPEFKFWVNAARATTLSLILSLFSIFDVPVFWPILLFYFIILFTLTMRKQIQHMIKYRYLPFDFGKTKYGRWVVRFKYIWPSLLTSNAYIWNLINIEFLQEPRKKKKRI